MSTVIVIPARYGSTRFPGKPLALIHGKKLLHRTWLIAKSIRNIEQVWIATDDERIRDEATLFGAEVLMTRKDCSNGTERVYQCIQTHYDQKTKPRVIINLQGDAVLTPPWAIQAVVDKIQSDSSVQIATPATLMNRAQYEQLSNFKSTGQASGTMVGFDRHFDALYFSKSLIPHVREWLPLGTPVYRHIGLYAYRCEALKAWISLEPTPLETTEKLEQLRALENRIPIRIVPVDYRGRTHWSVDSPEDIQIVEKIIFQEGELL